MYLRNLCFALLLIALGVAPAFARTDVAITVTGTSSSPGEIALVGGLPPSGAPYWVVTDSSGAEVASGSGSTTLSLPTGSYSVEFVTTFTEDGSSYQDVSGQFDWASGTWAWLNGSSSSTDIPDGPVENWIPFDEPQGWVSGPWTPDASTVWEDQTFTQNRTDTQLHLTGERSSLDSTRTRNLGSYTEYFIFPPQTAQGTKPLNPRIVSSSDSWGAWSGSAPAETADNPPWSWGSWSPSPGWYWEDQPATTTTQTRTGTRTVTYTTGSYTQTRTGTRTDNWTNDRGNTWSTNSGLSGSQTIPSSTRTEAQPTSDSQTVADTPRALNPRHVLSTGVWTDYSAWSPDASTVPSGQTFTQTRTFRRWNTDYWTNDRGDIWNDLSAYENSSESQQATGTGAVPNSAPTGSLTGSTTLTALESGTWNFSAADVDGNLAQWRFYNSTNPGAAYSPITTGSSVSGTHTQSFATAGPQTWKLDVMDADGATVTKTLAVTVNPASQAAVTLTPARATVTAGDSATFTAAGGNGAGAFTWGGTAGATGTGTSQTITFPTAGTFTVTVFRAGDATYVASTTASVSVTVGAASDTIAPSAPTGLATTFVAAASFTLSWTASTDNIAVTGYEVRLDGGVPEAAAGAGGLSHTFTGLAFNSTHLAEVRARDAAGNWSGWSAHTAATNSGSIGAGGGQSAWGDVDGDGIHDEIVPADSQDFFYTIVEWHTFEPSFRDFAVNDHWARFDAVFIDADGGRLFEGFSQIFDYEPLTLTDTWFELVFNIKTQKGRPYSIYSDSISQPDANGRYPIDPANWTLLAQSETTPTADGTQVVSQRFVDAFAFVGAQFFYVRKGLPIGSVAFRDQDGNELTPGIDVADPTETPTEADLRLPSNGVVDFSVWDETVRLIGSEHTISWKIWDATGNALQRSGLGLSVDFSGLPFGDYLLGLILDGATPRTTRIKTVGVTVKKVEFIEASSQLIDYSADFAGSIGIPFSPRGWVLGGPNNPVAHLKGLTPTLRVTVEVRPAGRIFRLRGFSQNLGLEFQSLESTATGTDQVLQLTAMSPLPLKIDTLEGILGWSITLSNNVFLEANPSGPHKLFLTWGSLGSGPTLKRVEWVSTVAKGASSSSMIADAIYEKIFSLNLFCGVPSATTWGLLDPNGQGDCANLAALMADAYNIVGSGGASPAQVRKVMASITPGAGNSLGINGTPISRASGLEFLIFDFSPLPLLFNWNAFEGCTEAAGSYYAHGIKPMLTAPNDYEILKALGGRGVQQVWVRTTNNITPGEPGWSVSEISETGVPIP